MDPWIHGSAAGAADRAAAGAAAAAAAAAASAVSAAAVCMYYVSLGPAAALAAAPEIRGSMDPYFLL